MADAAEPFAAAVRAIGSCHPWPPVMKCLEERANEAIEQGKVALAGDRSDGTSKTLMDTLIGFIDHLFHNSEDDLQGPLGEIIKEVNPTDDDRNCVYIVYAVVSRLRGIDPKAVAPAGMYHHESERINRLFQIKFQPGTFDEILDRVIRSGDGTIAIIRITFPDRTGHVVVEANFNGQVGIIEAQGRKQLIVSPEDADAFYNAHGNNTITYGIVP